MPSSLRSLVVGAVLTGLAVGCADRVTDVSPPEAPLAPLFSKAPGARYVDGSYIVVFKRSVANVDGQVEEIGRRFRIKSAFRYQRAIKGFAGKLPPAVVEALRADPRVAYIEQDQIARIVNTQTNPPSWGLDRIDQRARPLSSSYSYDGDGSGVDAYIIDTGIRTTHGEFGGRAVPGFDAVTAGGTAVDGNGHGTHVAGTVGGATYGVAKGVRLIAVRVLNNAGSGTYSGVIAGVDWVTADHVDRPAVANMSLGGAVSAALDDAVRRSIADGVTYAVAAGNLSVNASTQSPANVAQAITVGATDINDGFASFSNFGAGVDLSAPGVSITSSWHTSTTATNTISGTSMAAPHAAGAAALYLQAHPAATPAEVESALTSSATSGAISGVPAGTPNRLLYSVTAPPPPPPPPPAAPEPASPADGETEVVVPAALAWNPSSGAGSYRVQVSESESFTTLASNQSVTTTAASVPALTGGTVYYWRVNATNAGGTSAWSGARSFTTAATPPPPTPTAAAPANGATGVSLPPSLSWAGSSGAESYGVQVSLSSDFVTLAYDQSVTTTSTSVPLLSGGTLYYWRVNATNDGGTSDWSSTSSFTTIAPPTAPTPGSPTSGATGVTLPAALSWNGSSGAGSYRVQVSASPAFTTLAYNQSVTGTSTSVSGLSANTVYHWRVNATNGGGTSAWSATSSFTTAASPPATSPATPTLLSPANAATGVSVPATLSWNVAARATSYRAQVSLSSSFGTRVINRSVTTTSTIASGLAARTRYYWRVRASNAIGNSGWSSVRSFTTR